MSRAKKSLNRTTNPDPKYNSLRVTKFINRVMKDGKKETARTQVYEALEILEKQAGRPAVEVFEDVLRTVTPQMEVRSRRVGGAAYQVPMPVRGNRGSSLALRWLIENARKRPSTAYHTFAAKLASEMLDSLKGEGGTIAKRNAVHKMADANKAFAHFRW